MRRSATPGDKLPAVLLAAIAVASALVLRRSGSDLSFLITPAAKVVGLFTGAPHVPIDDGMAFHSLGIVIDRSCSGASFLTVLLSVFALLLWRMRRGGPSDWWWAIALLLLAYPVTLLVNSARIVGILQLQRMLGPLSPTVHELLGGFLLLGFLFLISLIITHLTRPTDARTA